MILLLVVVFGGIVLSLLYGWGLEFIAIKFLKLREDYDIHVSITVLLGVALLSGLLGIWSFYRGSRHTSINVFSFDCIAIGYWNQEVCLC